MYSSGENEKQMYSGTAEYLNALLTKARARDPKFSLRQFARKLGYANPSYICDIVHGRRRLKADLAEKITCVLDLNLQEREALQAMSGPRVRCGHAPNTLRQASTFTLDKFRFIADWYHLAILELSDLKEPPADPEAISKRLRRRVSRAMVELVLARLQRLGLIRFVGDRYVKTQDDFFVGRDAPSEAIRMHHLQTLELARESLEKDSFESRIASGTFIAINKSDWPRIKALVADFHNNLHAIHSAGEADKLIRINTQVFSLTDEDKL